MKVVIIHNVTGATKTVALDAPSMSIQMSTAGLHVVLRAATTGPTVGEAMFHTGGLVALKGTAIGQYGITEAASE